MRDFPRLAEIIGDSESYEGAARTALRDGGSAEPRRYYAALVAMKRLEQWGDAFDALERLIHWGSEIDLEFEYRAGPRIYSSARLTALAHLCLLANQTAHEVLVLLRADHEVGALSRWRRLYEFSVLISFLADLDDKEAARFQRHEQLRLDRATVQRYRISKDYGYERDDPETVREAQKRIDDAESEFGKDFSLEYGWAHEPLLAGSPKYARAYEQGRRRNPGLQDLARAVELDMFAAEYAEASASVHASTQLDGLVGGVRALRMAAHNTCYAVSVSCGRFVLSESDLIDEDLDGAVETLTAMSHQVAALFAPPDRLDAEQTGFSDG